MSIFVLRCAILSVEMHKKSQWRKQRDVTVQRLKVKRDQNKMQTRLKSNRGLRQTSDCFYLLNFHLAPFTLSNSLSEEKWEQEMKSRNFICRLSPFFIKTDRTSNRRKRLCKDSNQWRTLHKGKRKKAAVLMSQYEITASSPSWCPRHEGAAHILLPSICLCNSITPSRPLLLSSSFTFIFLPWFS